MIRLVYLSPAFWDSFEQRPHKFVRWYHSRTHAPVLWIEPYPARFPKLRDLTRTQKHLRTVQMMDQPPNWLRVMRPYALPIEPLPGAVYINRLLWASIVAEISRFVGSDEALIVIGKPSQLALQILADFPRYPTVYDAMDDFPFFHKGLARRTMRECERKLVSRVARVLASSHTLHQRLSQQRSEVKLVPNGLDPALLPVPRERRSTPSPVIFGYVGTMADWFDWELVVTLASVRPHDRVRLIGPVYVPPKMPLPSNIELQPPLPHAQALQAMNAFDVGLIPFKRNSLTANVDPIKYYEYRALGLPVMSTKFGEMANRQNEPGVYLILEASDISEVASRAVLDSSKPDVSFVHRHSWDAMFDAAELLDLR